MHSQPLNDLHIGMKRCKLFICQFSQAFDLAKLRNLALLFMRGYAF